MDDAREVLREVWSAQGQTSADLDEDCGPTKACKKMADVGFDGLADEDGDLRAAWRNRLQREGKLNEETGSIRDLVLGSAEVRVFASEPPTPPPPHSPPRPHPLPLLWADGEESAAWSVLRPSASSQRPS